MALAVIHHTFGVQMCDRHGDDFSIKARNASRCSSGLNASMALSTISFNVIATLPSSMANCRFGHRGPCSLRSMEKLNDHDERHLVSQSHADWVSRLVETRESMSCAETKRPASLRWRVAV
jgi:hypothetical protein